MPEKRTERESRVNPDQRVEPYEILVCECGGQLRDECGHNGGYRVCESCGKDDYYGRSLVTHLVKAIPLSAVSELAARARRATEAFKTGRGPWLDPSYHPLADALADLDELLARFPVPDEKEESDGR